MVRLLLQALLNYAEGYALTPEKRWRCCGGLLPGGHSPGCIIADGGRSQTSDAAGRGLP